MLGFPYNAFLFILVVNSSLETVKKKYFIQENEFRNSFLVEKNFTYHDVYVCRVKFLPINISLQENHEIMLKADWSKTDQLIRS